MLKLNSRLTLINQKSPAENSLASLVLLFAITLLGSVYFMFAYCTFSGLWYHKVLCILSTIIFMYLCQQAYFEVYENRIAKELPNTLKKLAHYYGYHKGNVQHALEATISRCPKNNRIYIIKIKEALLRADCEKQIEILESKMPMKWLKLLCRLLLFAKENGGMVQSNGLESGRADVIAANLKRLTNMVTLLNIEQGYNDAELLGMQIFVFFAPFLVIPITKLYNSYLLTDLHLGNIYKSMEAQNLTAMMMVISGAGALFIHWMRKLQN
ncbi:MAG TPA: hypothetical protein VN549_01885 [Negativicutes bacterium]|nr:hypothetical protein [Negativicutes bacterium]